MTWTSPFCPWCPNGLLYPHGEHLSALWRCGACGRIHVMGLDPYEPYRSPNWTPDWWQDAHNDEVCAFRLSSANPPDGSGIPGLDSQELRRLLAVAQPRLGDRKVCTPWLERYAGQLVAESRARRGAA